MKSKQTICLLNDCFPPQIDGVSNTVLNYAEQIMANGMNTFVVTPSHPQANDNQFSYPVVRFPSVSFKGNELYRMGIPYSPKVAGFVKRQSPALLHTHCPIMSTFMARELRHIVDAPIILTYHTNFAVDIADLVDNKLVQKIAKKALVANIGTCNEVWAVSHGAGENLRALGYEGDYVVMLNGVDLPRERLSDDQIAASTQTYDIPVGVPVYLFVGRMMWYKGIKIILDALSLLNADGKDFRMVFIGDGTDRKEIEEYAKTHKIDNKCIFTGSISDRETLRAWYCRSNLFLFPSTADTYGLVVREAAACGLPSVLVKDSYATEGVTEDRNGFLIEENGESMYRCLSRLNENLSYVREVGICASQELYLSWEDSVKAAIERYQIVIDRYKSGYYPKNRKFLEGLMRFNGWTMDKFSHKGSKN